MEKFLRAADIANMFATKASKAAAILAEHGVLPVSFGVGPYRGRRWLESAVNAAMREMHGQAQIAAPAQKPGRKQKPAPAHVPLAALHPNEIYILTQANPIQ